MNFCNIKVKLSTRVKLKVLAEKEELNLNQTVDSMIDFFIENNISVKSKLDLTLSSLGKLMDDNTVRIIKILKSFEKIYFSPQEKKIKDISEKHDKLFKEVEEKNTSELLEILHDEELEHRKINDISSLSLGAKAQLKRIIFDEILNKNMCTSTVNSMTKERNYNRVFSEDEFSKLLIDLEQLLK